MSNGFKLTTAIFPTEPERILFFPQKKNLQRERHGCRCFLFLAAAQSKDAFRVEEGERKK